MYRSRERDTINVLDLHLIPTFVSGLTISCQGCHRVVSLYGPGQEGGTLLCQI